jgi:hypothetical protein
MTEPVKSAFTARDKQDATNQIVRWIEECSRGVSDREADALALAGCWGIETDAIKEGFREARQEWAAKPKSIAVHRRKLVVTKPEGYRAALDAAINEAKQNVEAKREVGGLFISPATQPAEEPEAEAQSKGALTVIEPSSSAIVPADETPEEKAVREMNDKHAVISNLGGKCVIMEWVSSAISEGQKELSYQSFQAFRERYANQHVIVPRGRGGWDNLPFAPIWLAHPHRRQYEGLDLVPGGDRVLPNGYLNLWKGWGVEPRKGSWKLMRRHVAEVLANGNQVFEDFIIRLTAWKLQNPGQRPEVVLALLGGKGAGKGVWGYIQMLIYGSHGLQIFSTEHLIGKHNQHLQNKLFLFLDEAVWAGDTHADRVLKGLTTEKWMFIEPKNINGFQWPNRLGIYMSGNDKWIVPASHDERRYAVNAISEKWKKNPAYFGPLFEEVNGGGAAAMLHDLLEFDLDGWHPRDHVPQTKALLDQKMLGLTGLEQWYVHLLNVGELPNETPAATLKAKTQPNPRFVISERLMVDAKGHTLRNKYLTDTELGRFMSEMGCEHKSNGKKWGWVFPPLADARNAWRIRAGGDWEWLTHSIADWREKPADETADDSSGAGGAV